MFSSTKLLLQKAQRGKYAVPHFNVNNLEILQGVLRAAEKLKAPIVLATSEGALSYAGMDYLLSLAETAKEKSTVPLAFHLDHGRDLTTIHEAIRKGYSSVMIDASHERFETNIRLTRKVVQWAHPRGVAVEAELGTIGGAEDLVTARSILYTNPEEAKEFVERTGCDFLAVAIGTSHGAHKFAGKAQLNLALLQKIRAQVKIPLVLHGASGVPAAQVKESEKYGSKLKSMQGVPDTQLRKAIQLGITKINTDTDLRLAFDAALRKAVMMKPEDIDPRHLLGPARDAIQNVAEQRIRLFGCAGKR